MPASVRKAALVLDLFSVERPYWGPTEVADELGIAKSTAHALLGELTSVGLTERLPCGRYRLGWRTVGLARTMLATSDHRDVIKPTVRRLASHFDETVHVTAWERGRVLYVASERPPGGVAAPAGPVAAQLTPPGTVLLAERDGETGGGLDPDEAERVRRRGYAVGTQRALEGVDCAAATGRRALP
jgi:DNA-binding IclR family transcriptional regulator